MRVVGTPAPILLHADYYTHGETTGRGRGDPCGLPVQHGRGAQPVGPGRRRPGSIHPSIAQQSTVSCRARPEQRPAAGHGHFLRSSRPAGRSHTCIV
jgi:hypothetical protein